MFKFSGKNGPLLIAEIGGNHEGDFEYAKKLVNLAIESNADCIKLQIYRGDSLVSEVENPTRNKHFKKFEFSIDQYIELIGMVKEANKLFTASIWDTKLIDQLDEHIDFYKVGSGDLTAYPLLKHIATKNKPIVISAGLSNENEVVDSVEFIQNANGVYKSPEMLAVLQCTSMYPIHDEDANLAVMDRFANIMDVSIGYSDHTIGSKAIFYAAVKGAEIIEFHFTDIKENRSFRDHQVSLTKKDVLEFIDKLSEFQVFNGISEKKPLPIEIENNHVETFRRAVYPSRDIEPGEIITESDLVVLRPNHGIDAREFYNIIGMQVVNKIYKHRAFKMEDLRGEVI